MADVETTELQNIQVSGLISEPGRKSTDVDFLDFSLVLARSWRSIAIVTLVCIAAGGLVSFLIRPRFTATAIIIPPQQQQSVVSAMAGELTSLAQLGSGGSGSSASLFKNPGELYVGILKSRTIADNLIETYHLESDYKTASITDARARLKRHTDFEAEKDGLISIAVTDHNPQRASDLANGYIDELYKLNSNLAITEAAQRRVFFDQELVKEKTALNASENELEGMEQKSGVVQLNGQTQEIIRSIAQIRAEIESREVQIASLQTFATNQNPETIRLQQEIDALRNQLAGLENSQIKLAPGDIQVPAGRVPEVVLEYERKLRDVRYHEALYELLTKQYEAARIDEAKSVPLVQVIDRAVPPDKRSGPPRILITLGSGLVGFLGACAWALGIHGYQRMKLIPENAVRLSQLRQEFFAPRNSK